MIFLRKLLYIEGLLDETVAPALQDLRCLTVYGVAAGQENLYTRVDPFEAGGKTVARMRLAIL